MLYFITKFFNYLLNFDNQNDFETDEDKEMFLAEQLLEIEIQNEKETVSLKQPVKEIPRNAVCFQKTGIITYCDENCVLIDGSMYCDVSTCSLNLNINDKVLYMGYKDTNDTVVIVRILENQGLFWGDEKEEDEAQNFNIIEHVLVGQVECREDRFVYINESELRFNLDDVTGTFVPLKGDWLELKCSIQHDENKPCDISVNQVLKVLSFSPLRTKIKSSMVSEWSGSYGICDRQIYFDSNALQNGTQLNVGSKVMVEAIESSQGACTWRAIKLILIETGIPRVVQNEVQNEEQISINLEKQKNIDITFPLKFEQISFGQSEKIKLDITNRSQTMYTLNKWLMLSRKRDSQLNIKPFINQPAKLAPGETITFTIICNPKFLGNAKECLVIVFKGFQFKRYIEMNVINNTQILSSNSDDYYQLDNTKKVQMMKKLRNNNGTFIPGIRLCKTPAFVSVKIGQYPIPEKIWSVILGDSEQTIYSHDFDKILSRIEMYLPFLTQELNINNYIDRWHTLLYMEEIQANLNMRIYDRNKVYLINCQEYLGLEMPGLSEKRPSLIKGDRVVVKDIWNAEASKYEGFIHTIKGDMVLLKFSPQFHETYGGSDVSIEFHFSRTIYRRSHHAINQSLSNLGPEILFPSRVSVKQLQVADDKIENINWFNKNLNSDQRNAIINILKGECRPMPYIIFGPPGTGKTVTVIETILQILSLVPESRILVATPSNSASNLITERLVQYKESFTGSIVRLIANYLVDSDTIPESVKPYCATLDISIENTSKSKHTVKDNINLNCRKSSIGRHRVTIGTCYCLGALKHLDLLRGHFTHIIVDEAGQATEPEIMLPLSFTDKWHGQIILAGDPMQLGPVVVSKYCKEFGMDESFLCRLLERFPYLKDYASSANGFDKRLVTKLNDNYRSLKEVLTLPSEMFYDGTLIPKIDKTLTWTSKFVKATGETFDLNNDGGIFVYGIKGVNVRGEDSPSWYNPQEASMVALTTCKLYKRNVTADDIGIITPYIAQTKYIRLVFDSMGLPQPKIGTVEDFQGQERPIILISTVRSSESFLQEDIKHTLGFVKSPKRLNVAITRAQISAILFCNPHLLCKDPLWKKVIDYAVLNEKYMGCDLPYDYIKNN